MKWNREEFLAYVFGQKTDRMMFVELFGPLVGLDAEWRAQGASEDELALTAFDWDYVYHIGLGGICNTGLFGGFTEGVIEETAEYILTRDRLGRVNKLCKGFATIPLPQSHPVQTMDDWRKIKHMFTYNDQRIDRVKLEWAAKEQRDAGAYIMAGIEGGYDLPRQLMGEENACLCYYEDPELMHDILKTAGDTAVRVLEQAGRVLKIDHLGVHEDMAGKSGPLAGPDLIREFIAPYYRRCYEVAQAAGARVFMQDSDGNMNAVMEEFLNTGLNGMHPFEPAAGMDMVASKKMFGDRLRLVKGGIDKHVLRGTKEEIRRELEYKMQPLMRKGGIVFGLDHRIPNGTPLENYRYYVQTGREILGLPPLDGRTKGWHRMAG